jgi:hypothetical protein
MVLRCDHIDGLCRRQAILELEHISGCCGSGDVLATTCLLLLPLLCRLDSITTLDDICLETDWTRSAMQLEEEAAGVAED